MNLFNRMMPADYAYKLLSGKNYVFYMLIRKPKKDWKREELE